MYFRQTNLITDFITFEKVGGKKMPDVPLFVLTSKSTFSGGEEFAYDIQTQKRGILIGETTGGGANPGRTFPVTNAFGIFIPTGRAINPITKTNWEGVGVVPDISCSTDKALDTAITHAAAAAKAYRDKKDNLVHKRVEDLKLNIDNAVKLFNENQNEKAEEIIVKNLDKALEQGLADEFAINEYGYNYLRADKTKAAIAVFKYNAKAFPKSSNVYDSLGEALMTAGDKENALINYKKSLELDPQNKNAEETIRKLESNSK
jgi:hypothetical protein